MGKVGAADCRFRMCIGRAVIERRGRRCDGVVHWIRSVMDSPTISAAKLSGDVAGRPEATMSAITARPA